MDEPTSGLDPSTARSIHQLILELKERGTTIFLTTHRMEEAARLCEQVALLCNGEIVESGKPEDICNRHCKLAQVNILLKEGSELCLGLDGGSGCRAFPEGGNSKYPFG